LSFPYHLLPHYPPLIAALPPPLPFFEQMICSATCSLAECGKAAWSYLVLPTTSFCPMPPSLPLLRPLFFQINVSRTRFLGLTLPAPQGGETTPALQQSAVFLSLVCFFIQDSHAAPSLPLVFGRSSSVSALLFLIP